MATPWAKCLEDFRQIGTRPPSLADLHNHVIPKYAHHWKKLASNVGLPLSVIQTIEYSFPNDPVRCCEKMFEHWLEQDIHASWEKLLNTIDKIRCVAMPPAVLLDNSTTSTGDQALGNSASNGGRRKEEPTYSLKELEEIHKGTTGELADNTRVCYNDLTAQQKKILDEVQAMIVVVNDSEFMATMCYLKPPNQDYQSILEVHCSITLGHTQNPLIFYIGMFGKCPVAVARVDAGFGRDAINHSDCFKNVLLIAAVGVAAGFPENGVDLGDVIISQQITDCSLYKQTDGIYIPRGTTTSASKYMINRLKNKFHWEFACSKEGAKSSIILGKFLSKPMLLNDPEERGKILKYFGEEAKGYEMEGYSITGEAIACIIVKGVCDFASGKDKIWQPTAALAANNYLHYHLSQMDLSNMKDNPHVQGNDISEPEGSRLYNIPQEQQQQVQNPPQQNDDHEEPDGDPRHNRDVNNGSKNASNKGLTHQNQNGGAILDMNNHNHHEMILQLTEYLEGDNVDYRKLYRFFQLTEVEKSKIEDSKTGQIYETLSQYVETKKPTTSALIENLQKCKVTQEYIEFVANYKY